MDAVHIDDAIRFLKKLSRKPRLILTDPPYGMNYRSRIAGDRAWNKTGIPAQERIGRPGTFDVLPNDDSPEALDFPGFFRAAYDALEDDGLCFCFASDRALARWGVMAVESGFEWRDTLIWNKRCANGGDLRWPFIRVTEFILCLVKGNPVSHRLLNEDGKLQQRVVNVFNSGRVPRSEYCGHPTQKPLRVCDQLIRATTEPGEYVVDPFCGVGSILASAKRLRRHYDGCDISDAFVRRAQARLTTIARGAALVPEELLECDEFEASTWMELSLDREEVDPAVN